MQTLKQLKIKDTVYDLAAKFDAEDNNIKDTYSTKEYVTQKISELVNSAPGTLDTLNEIAAALNNDSNFAATITTQLGTKVDKVEGKQLSTEDFTAALKTSLESLPEEISGKYVKPSGGIPKTDLSSEVQASLDKADSAIQDITSKVDNSTYTEDKKTFALKTEIPTTLPASDVSDWAKASVKPTYTAAEIGLDQVNNTSDMDKPISTETQAALDGKVDKVEGKQLSTEDFTAALKTSLESLPEEISGKYVKPSGGIPKTDLSSEVQASLDKADSAIQDITSKVDNSTYTEDKKTFALKTEIPTTLPASDVSDWAKASVKPTYTAAEIGLDQVNNTSDMDKPISTKTQAALDGKVDKVEGKQLSTNDYSDEEKSTVAQLKAAVKQLKADVEQLKSTVATLTTSLQELKAKA